MSDIPIRLTAHAEEQAQRRRLPQEEILEVVRVPQQTVPVREGREVRQSLVDNGRYLLRVVVDTSETELVVVTMYKTSKIRKFWQP